ncbi:futalosine hydrolase [Geomesophilobacter sediminis]|uniref:Futalosine hydrolase n=1 Tax=Geomesophilobacter sediminis TaxID=2798584 RepID=A0A8J7S997_9BACT|nr:futalosine hydrolase [Geomesophilobacter sediminis]MBJ6726625.1 futalosine hydrolase [Geomesophilobacter sediminis]
MSPVIVTASTEMEVSLLISGCSALPVAGFDHPGVYRGERGGSEVIIGITGIGKVNAAYATTLLLERYTPRLLVNTGCGGAFPGSGLGVGDLAVASSESLADEGVQTPQGWRGLDLIGIPVFEKRGEKVFNEIPLARDLAEQARFDAETRGYRTALGGFLTVSTCSGTAVRGTEMLQRFPGICENMEGGAVAQVALIYGVPFLELRGISNLVEDRDFRRWNLQLAVTNAQQFLLTYLDNLNARQQ